MELCPSLQVESGYASYSKPVTSLPPALVTLIYEWLSWKVSVKLDLGYLWISWEPVPIVTSR